MSAKFEHILGLDLGIFESKAKKYRGAWALDFVRNLESNTKFIYFLNFNSHNHLKANKNVK